MLCEICKEACPTGRELAQDHDHVTGKIRGRLCLRCNVGLGYFRDNSVLLFRAIEYLRGTLTKRLKGQIAARGANRWLVRKFIGKVQGKRQYLSHTVHGTHSDAEEFLKEWHTNPHTNTGKLFDNNTKLQNPTD